MKRPQPLWLAPLMLICVCPASAIAQVMQFQTPKDNELRSAYCLSVLNSQISWTQNEFDKAYASAKSGPTLPPSVQDWVEKKRSEMRESVAKMETARERIKAYLLPKMMILDPAAMALAMKRGEEDWQALGAMTQQCSAKCSPEQRLPEDQARACWSSCTDAALVDRIRACSSPTWLPF